MCHVLAYAEILLAWNLPEKRGELLKLVESDIQGLSLDATVADETLYSSPVGQSCRIVPDPVGILTVSSCRLSTSLRDLRTSGRAGDSNVHGMRRPSARPLFRVSFIHQRYVGPFLHTHDILRLICVSGLFHVCSKCLHVSHMKCWRARDDASCATGCGCICALPAFEPLSSGAVVLSPIMQIYR